MLKPSKASERTVLQESADNPEQAVAEISAEPMAGERFGLKEKQPRAAVSTTVKVKAIRKNLADRFVYTTQDGQIWLQIDTRRARYDEVPFDAEIRSASLGSFYLKPKSGGASVRVRREK